MALREPCRPFLFGVIVSIKVHGFKFNLDCLCDLLEDVEDNHSDSIILCVSVVFALLSLSRLLENIGVESVTIKSGEYKDIMSSTRDMTEEEQQIMQTLNDNAFNRFVQVIAEGRGMTEAEVREIADGRIYDGIQAKQIGLVDDFGYLEDVTAAMKLDLGIENAQVVRYTSAPNFKFSQFFSATMQNLSGESSELSGLMQTLTQSNSPRLMYLYTE